MFIFQEQKQIASLDDAFGSSGQGPKEKSKEQQAKEDPIQEQAKTCVKSLDQVNYFKQNLNLGTNVDSVKSAINDFYTAIEKNKANLEQAGKTLFDEILKLLPQSKNQEEQRQNQELAAKTVLYATAFREVKDKENSTLLKETSSGFWKKFSAKDRINLITAVDNHSTNKKEEILNYGNISYLISIENSFSKEDRKKDETQHGKPDIKEVLELNSSFVALYNALDFKEDKFLSMEYEKQKFKFPKILTETENKTKTKPTIRKEISSKMIDDQQYISMSQAKSKEERDEITVACNKARKDIGLNDKQIAEANAEIYNRFQLIGRQDICSEIFDYMKTTGLFEALDIAKQNQMRIAEMQEALNKLVQAAIIPENTKEAMMKAYEKALEYREQAARQEDKTADLAENTVESKRDFIANIERQNEYLEKVTEKANSENKQIAKNIQNEFKRVQDGLKDLGDLTANFGKSSPPNA